MPPDLRDRLLAVQEKAGFIPNVFLTLAHRPDEFRAFFAYHDALMERPGNLTKAEREMIVVATNYRKADITAHQKAMLDFALKVSEQAHRVDDADFATLAGHGFSDDDVWDIAAISAFFGLSNRMANVTSMRPNTEFYAMGR
ncbi:alkylhydroperoxidase [Comamonas serinivorans]|uniref:Alkylhydroperoxidase n=1 Tax=Comamonas serinivorans TaxID=1082851 RepID=A0A1Y0EML2_9BURK|nr:carboxymuconolactone decarboxylase family protein [Comamonas serinivorans]ARU04638.1 alkylhydroperoxidase [Comamonas serinivorans]